MVPVAETLELSPLTDTPLRYDENCAVQASFHFFSFYHYSLYKGLCFDILF